MVNNVKDIFMKLKDICLSLLSILMLLSACTNLNEIEVEPNINPNNPDNGGTEEPKPKVDPKQASKKGLFFNLNAYMPSLKPSKARAGELVVFMDDDQASREPLSVSVGDKIDATLVISDGVKEHTIYQQVKLIAKVLENGQACLNFNGEAKLSEEQFEQGAWYVSAIIGGNIKDDEFLYYPNKTMRSYFFECGVHIGYGGDAFNIPFVTKWYPLKGEKILPSKDGSDENKSEDQNNKAQKNSAGAEAESKDKTKEKAERVGYTECKLDVDFKLLGHIIRLRLKNNEDSKFLWSGINMEKGDYIANLKLVPSIDKCAERETYPYFKERGFSVHKWNFEKSNVLFENGDKSYILPIYVCPKSEGASLPKQIHLVVKGERQGVNLEYAFDVPVGAQGKMSYSEFTLPARKNIAHDSPLSFWVKGNCNKNADVLVEKEQGDLFQIADLDRPKLKEVLDFRGERVPAEKDWATIFPSSNTKTQDIRTILRIKNCIGFWRQNYHETPYVDTYIDEHVYFPKRGGGYTEDSPLRCKSVYRDMRSDSTVYAIRFMDKKNYNRSAWRYERVINSDQERGIRVSYLYLGSARTEGIDDISSKEFWTNMEDKDLGIVTRFFPESRPSSGFFEQTYYMSSYEKEQKKLYNYMFAFREDQSFVLMAYVDRGRSYKYTKSLLRLIKNEPID